MASKSLTYTIEKTNFLNYDELLKEVMILRKDNDELNKKLFVKEFDFMTFKNETKKIIQELIKGNGMTIVESLVYNAHMEHVNNYK